MCVCVCVGGGGGTISAEGRQYLLTDSVLGGQNLLADFVREDKFCSDIDVAI